MTEDNNSIVNENVNKIVLEPDQDFSYLSLPSEAMKMLRSLNPFKKINQTKEEEASLAEEEKQRKKANDKYDYKPVLIPKLTYVDGKFVVPPDILKTLNLNLPLIQEENENLEKPEEIDFGSSIMWDQKPKVTKPEATKQPETPKENSSEKFKEAYTIASRFSSTDINVSKTNEYTIEEKHSLVKSFNIIDEGIFLGIAVGFSNKEQVKAIMERYSKIKYEVNGNEPLWEFPDMSITIYFEENVVSQMEFGKTFRGVTSKGLKIGDSIEKATELYGPPIMKAAKGVIWKNLKVFCQDGDGIITSIKFQK